MVPVNTQRLVQEHRLDISPKPQPQVIVRRVPITRVKHPGQGHQLPVPEDRRLPEPIVLEELSVGNGLAVNPELPSGDIRRDRLPVNPKRAAKRLSLEHSVDSLQRARDQKVIGTHKVQDVTDRPFESKIRTGKNAAIPLATVKVPGTE